MSNKSVQSWQNKVSNICESPRVQQQHTSVCLNARVFLNRNKEFRKTSNFSLSSETSLSFASNWLNTCFREPDNRLSHRSHIRKSTRRYRCRGIVFKSLCSSTLLQCIGRSAAGEEEEKKGSNVIFTSHPSSGRLKKGAMDLSNADQLWE